MSVLLFLLVVLIGYTILSVYFIKKNSWERIENYNVPYVVVNLVILASIVIYVLYNCFRNNLPQWYYQIGFYYILSIQFTTAMITDWKYHEIDRWLSRAGYVTSIILSTVYIVKYTDNSKMLLITMAIGVVGLFLLLLFFGDKGIGVADYRVLIMILPMFIAVYQMYFFVVWLIEAVVVSTGQFFRQKKKGKGTPIPIGPDLIFLAMVPIYLQQFLQLYS